MKKLIYALWLLGFAILVPCGLKAQDDAVVRQAEPQIAVVPFQAILPVDHSSSTVQCPVCGNVHSSGSIAKGAEKIVEDIFVDQLSRLKNVEVVQQERASAVYRRIAADSLKKTVLQVVQKTGQELRVDYIVVGFVYRYKERIGYNYSAERPASVTYEIHLISVKDGKSIWRGAYDKTQKSLMEDVFQASSFLKGGARWVTARQLTKLGIDEIMATFPELEK